MRSSTLKRAVDLLGAAVALLLLAPLLLVVGLIIRRRMGSPVLFGQLRPGFHGKLFTICKFRTMCDLFDANGSMLPDEQRLTRFGRFLRSTSLDELPEFWNVPKGMMSLA